MSLSSQPGTVTTATTVIDPNGPEADQEITTAVAYLSSTGPCQGFGDLYLTCVATAGLAMCRSLRAEFERCSKAQQAVSVQVLQDLGEQLCRHIPDKGGATATADRERLLCAANLMNQQLMQSYSAAQAAAAATGTSECSSSTRKKD